MPPQAPKLSEEMMGAMMWVGVTMACYGVAKAAWNLPTILCEINPNWCQEVGAELPPPEDP